MLMEIDILECVINNTVEYKLNVMVLVKCIMLMVIYISDSGKIIKWMEKKSLLVKKDRDLLNNIIKDC